MRQLLRRGSGRSIRTRLLAIVLVPSLALVAIGVGGSVYLVKQGLAAREWATKVQRANVPAVEFFGAMQEERRLSLLRLAGDGPGSAGLERVRTQADGALVLLNEFVQVLRELNPEAVGRASNDAAAQAFAKLPAIRTAIDKGAITGEQTYLYYDGLIQSLGQGIYGITRSAKDAQTATQLDAALSMFDVVDGMTRAHANGAGSIAAGGFTPENHQFYRIAVTYYRVQITVVVPRMDAHGQAQYKALVASPAYKRLGAVETALIARGPRPGPAADTRPLPVSFAQWQKDAQEVTNAMQAMWVDQFRAAEQGAADRGRDTFIRSGIAGVAVLFLAAIAMLIALRLANTVIRRLKRLRADTLELADERLPEVVESLRTGKAIDLATDVPELEYGHDEVGQVADAFNKAQRTAIAAAQQEAQAREGMNAVFLNIAHRSQMVAHRQLEVLDEAERKQEDPKHLELLFRIDHLATRARRNAENLVILGGERPGRKWRNPVPLDEIARGAVSETENFARVSTVRLPDIMIEGGMVADLIHLLAELVDNATSFSPPGTRVEVRGNLVGRGVVVEVEDQGLGMTESQRERLNHMLHDPPDFQVMALSRQMRLGLFVVAQLAGRHGIVVTLAESAYGGTRAIVLIPSAPSTVRPGIAGPPVPSLAGMNGAPRTVHPLRPPVEEIEVGGPALPERRQLYAPVREPRVPVMDQLEQVANGEVDWQQPAANGQAHYAAMQDQPGSVQQNAYWAPAQGNDFPAWPESSWAPEDEMRRRAGEHRPLLPPREPARSIPARDGEGVELDAAELVSPEPVSPEPAPPGPASQYMAPLPYPANGHGTTPNGNGQPPNGNGAPTGGTAHGGTANGGTANGGTANGGTANGGTASGGTANSAADTGTPAADPQHRHASGGRAPLPRRRKQANMAPQLAAEIAPPDASGAESVADRSPEQIRDTMSAMLRGTRQGREERPDTRT
jgi:signal transduction histidine kinase